METIVYISITLATILYITGFIMLFLYKRDKIKGLEEKLEALNNMLDSSDQMINELNSLSDYIASNIDDKTGYLKELLVEAERKINYLKINKKNEDKVEEEKPKPPKKTKPNIKKESSNTKKEPETLKVIHRPIFTAINAYENTASLIKKHIPEEETSEHLPDNATIDDIINNIQTINSSKEQSHSTREKEIVKLSHQGLDTTEIAKRMGMGKGEIELILGLKK